MLLKHIFVVEGVCFVMEIQLVSSNKMPVRIFTLLNSTINSRKFVNFLKKTFNNEFN